MGVSCFGTVDVDATLWLNIRAVGRDVQDAKQPDSANKAVLDADISIDRNYHLKWRYAG